MATEIGQVYAIADGDQTVRALVAAAGIPDAVKSIEIRCEVGTIAVGVGVALAALSDGRQLTAGNAWKEEAPDRGIIDLSRVHIFGVGNNDSAFIHLLTV